MKAILTLCILNINNNNHYCFIPRPNQMRQKKINVLYMN
jgi:hypothetical protein